MSKLPEGRKPLSWQDMPFPDRPKGHPSTERLEIEKLQERVAELEATFDDIWCYSVNTRVLNHEFRRWVEVETRSALKGKDDE